MWVIWLLSGNIWILIVSLLMYVCVYFCLCVSVYMWEWVCVCVCVYAKTNPRAIFLSFPTLLLYTNNRNAMIENRSNNRNKNSNKQEHSWLYKDFHHRAWRPSGGLPSIPTYDFQTYDKWEKTAVGGFLPRTPLNSWSWRGIRRERLLPQWL